MGPIDGFGKMLLMRNRVPVWLYLGVALMVMVFQAARGEAAGKLDTFLSLTLETGGIIGAIHARITNGGERPSESAIVAAAHAVGLESWRTMDSRIAGPEDHLSLSWTSSRSGRPVDSPVLRSRLASAAGPAVVVGPEGSGKTTLAQEIALGRAREGDAAIRVALSTWNSAEDVGDWLARRINETLRRHTGSRSDHEQIARMLAQGKIYLLLDGLDEMALEQSEDFVEKLRESGLRNWIIFTRESRLRLIESPHDNLVEIITIEPLDEVLVARELRISGAQNSDWLRVADRIEGGRDSAAYMVLSRPLYLTFARNLARAGHGAPAELVTQSATQVEVEASLMAAGVESMLSSATSTRSRKERDRRSLRTIAKVQDRTGLDDFAWWDVGDVAPYWATILLGATIAGVVFGVLDAVRVGLLSYWYQIDSQYSDLATPFGIELAAIVLACVPRKRITESAVGYVLTSVPIRLGATMGVIVFLEGLSESFGTATIMAGVAAVAIALNVAIAMGIVMFMADALDSHRELLGRIGFRRSSEGRTVPRKVGFRWSWATIPVAILVTLIPILPVILSGHRSDGSLYYRPTAQAGSFILATLFDRSSS
ncbi:AAA family ATPase [Luteipulveratus mongoliensis]|uniref:AAA+ ATPase domain-containing protein n=1 Tax=Luteipulveratus mongoliensis TaxID=571913 RepID=A0A0K1JDJ2_9MICO|nr:AAA family ATPase [Luteipulveratus mongoliensis]AKU14766.1 hypothetical protein VV02_00860 [Luteipulveratus mongoliensis]